MNNEQEVIILIKEAAQYLLDNETSKLPNPDFYTCNEIGEYLHLKYDISYGATTYLLNRISTGYREQLSNTITDSHVAAKINAYSAFINLYIEYKVDDRTTSKQKRELFKTTRIEWLTYIINYEEGI